MLSKDVGPRHLPDFLTWALTQLGSTDDPFLAAGIGQTLCELAKTLDPATQRELTATLYRALALLNPMLGGSRNAFVRKLRVKLSGRLAVAMLPQRARRRHVEGMSAVREAATDPAARVLMGGSASASDGADDEEEDDVPEEVEAIAQDLLEALRDDVRRRADDLADLSGRHRPLLGRQAPRSNS